MSVTKRIRESEFFADTIMEGGPFKTPADFFKSLTIAYKDYKDHPLYSEGLNTQILNERETLARAENNKHKEDAKKLLKHISTLRLFIQAGNLHGAVYVALLVERYSMRLVLREHEPNAKTGRKHRRTSHNTAVRTNRIRRTKARDKNREICDDYRRMIKATPQPLVISRLAKQYDLSKSQIRKKTERLRKTRASR